MGPNSGQIAFTDGQGIEYKFPASDVQSLAFGRIQDTVTLRNGKTDAGQYNGPEDMCAFRDGQGIDYNFPVRDLETIIFIQNSAPPAATTGVAVSHSSRYRNCCPQRRNHRFGELFDRPIIFRCRQ